MFSKMLKSSLLSLSTFVVFQLISVPLMAQTYSFWTGGETGTWNGGTWSNGIPGINHNGVAYFNGS
jgi:hypothetical protein